MYHCAVLKKQSKNEMKKDKAGLDNNRIIIIITLNPS